MRRNAEQISPAGRRAYDTRDEFCLAVSFMSAGILLPRPARVLEIQNTL